MEAGLDLGLHSIDENSFTVMGKPYDLLSPVDPHWTIGFQPIHT
jgi:hypothetical protein